MPDVIIKDMEMPEDCADCPIEADDFDECPFMHVHPIREAVEKRLGHRVIGWRCNYDKRPDWCPLSPAPEVVRCQECIHRPKRLEGYEDGDGFGLEFPDERCPCHCEDGWYSWMPPDDWFCANGERKKEGSP